MSRLDNFNKNLTKKSTPRKPRATYTPFNKKVWGRRKEEHRKTSTSCPEGYFDFTTGFYGEPETHMDIIPNNCIEVRARIRKLPKALSPPPTGRSLTTYSKPARFADSVEKKHRSK